MNNYVEGVRFIKSHHSAPSGGRSNWQNTDFCTSDFHQCRRMFHKNCLAEFNETWHNNYIECVVDAQVFFNRIIQRPLIEDQTLAKIQMSAPQTSIYVDEVFLKIVLQNSKRSCIAII